MKTARNNICYIINIFNYEAEDEPRMRKKLIETGDNEKDV